MTNKNQKACIDETLVIAKPQVITDADALYIRYPLKGARYPYLEYRLHKDFADFVSPQLDAALVALIVPAMAAGQNVHLAGTVSPFMLHNMRMDLMALLQSLIPGLKTVQITADCVAEPAPQSAPPAVLTGFSGGLDSLTVAAEYLDNPDTLEALRPTHFLFNDVGNHGRLHHDLTSNVDRALARVKASAARFGLPLICVRSNLDGFFDLTFEQTHTLRNTSTALLLQGRARHFLYASDCPYQKISGAAHGDTAYADTIILPLLSTPAIQCHAAGTAHNRIEKAAIIADRSWSHKILHVCMARPDKNCSQCYKCMKVLLILDAMGRIDDFSTVFDLGTFRRLKSAFIGHIMGCGTDDATGHDVFIFMKTVGYRPTLGERITSGLTWLTLTVVSTLPMTVQRFFARRLGFNDPATLSQGLSPNRLWTLKRKIACQLSQL